MLGAIVTMQHYRILIRRFIRTVVLLSGLLPWFPAGADNPSPQCPPQPGSQAIRLGTTTALSGPAQHLGESMVKGMLQRLKEENCNPFWRNKAMHFELSVLDDSYNPDIAERNTRHLINEHRVVALVGNVGTPTAARAWPIANQAGVIFYGAYTGASSLRQDPPAPYVFNYRGSYDQEMARILEEIVFRQRIAIPQIGIFFQNDAFGNAGLTAAERHLESYCGDCKHGLLKMRYERNTLRIADALQTFIQARPQPQALILVGTSEPCADLIRFTHRITPNTQFYSLSFVGASALAAELAGVPAKVFVGQVIPQLEDEKKFASTHWPAPGSDGGFNEVAREGYLALGVFFEAARDIDGAITSEALRESLLRTERRLSPTAKTLDQQMMDQVWLVQLRLSADAAMSSLGARN